MTKIEKKLIELQVWFRYVVCGEQEKDFEVHSIESVSIEEAIIEVTKLYPSSRRIPFAIYHNEQKFKPVRV